MTDHWEYIDLLKTLLSLAAGMLLGLERELKDKAAGLKTISIICLGATLFTIISFKIGGTEDTRIASYIVSGVGFIGAGVIFKDGLNVSGLTTAGIIWLAAAIGTSIGYGEFYLAGTFLAADLLLVYISPMINKLLISKRYTGQLEIEMERSSLDQKDEIISALQKNGVKTEEKKVEMQNNCFKFTFEVSLRKNSLKWLRDYLLHHQHIKAFTF
jgi:putative Mg2+ transporter-C (MgtC) family protein